MILLISFLCSLLIRSIDRLFQQICLICDDYHVGYIKKLLHISIITFYKLLLFCICIIFYKFIKLIIICLSHLYFLYVLPLVLPIVIISKIFYLNNFFAWFVRIQLYLSISINHSQLHWKKKRKRTWSSNRMKSTSRITCKTASIYRLNSMLTVCSLSVGYRLSTV